MDINNNQQINTFLKGMNTDVSDALIDSSQYRYAENLRLVTNTDSNEGELRIVDSTSGAYSVPGEILALTSVRDLLVAITYDKNRDGVSVYTNNNKGVGDWKQKVNNIPYSEFVLEDGKPHFSLVCRWESKNNIKLYIADGKHTIMCLNLAKSYVKLPNNTIEDVIAYSSTVLHAPTFEIVDGGQLMSARIQYAYRYYSTGEPATQMSPLSEIRSLYDGTNMGYEAEQVTTKAAVVHIPSASSDFDKIQVFRITYVLNGQKPTVNVVYDGPYIDTVQDVGQSVEQYSMAEFLDLTNLQIIPKIIESKHDYLFAGNIKYAQDQYDVELKDQNLDFRAYSAGDFDGEWPLMPPEDFNTVARNHNRQYDAGNNGNYDFSLWEYREYTSSIRHGGGYGPIVRWDYMIKQYYVDKNNDYYDGNQNLITDPVVSLKRGEVYRYGIVLYSNTGIKSSVKWIADIMVPEQELNSAQQREVLGTEIVFNTFGKYPQFVQSQWDGEQYVDVNKWLVNTYGIQFTVAVNKIQNCAGFEIVRCRRTDKDVFNITQGIVSFPYQIYNSEEGYIPTTLGDYLSSANLLTLQNIYDGVKYTQNRSYMQFASPENAYQPDDISAQLKKYKGQLSVKEIQSYYTPIIKSPGEIHAEESGRWESFGKFSSPFNDEKNALCVGCLYNKDGLYHKDPLHLGSLYKDVWNKTGDDQVPPNNKDQRANGIYETSITNVYAIENLDIDKSTTKIKSFEQVSVANPQHFFSAQKVPQFLDDIVPIGTLQFYKWVAFGLSYMPTVEHYEGAYDYLIENTRDGDITSVGIANAGYLDPISRVGKSIILELDSEHSEIQIDDPNNRIIAPITVANIVKNASPYNGPDTYKDGVDKYYSYGNYSAVEEGQSSISIEVFNGDCYPGLFIYTGLHAFDNSGFPRAVKAVVNYYVPIESDIDLRATYGDLYTRLLDNEKSYYVNDVAGAIDGFVQNKAEYMYNTAYNTDPDAVPSSTSIIEQIDDTEYDVRVHYSQRKINNEHVDNWTQFKTADFLDVDSRYKQLTDMRLFKNNLLFWQEDAFGVLSVNERVILNDIDDNNIVLGTGDVLQRFDYMTTIYGMRPYQYEAEVQSNVAQYWWDENRKEILYYPGGNSVTPLTKVKGLRNYINDNDPNDHPALIYNNKYDEVIFSVENNESLVYNEKIQFFTSIYKMMPLYRAVVDGTTILGDNDDLYHMDVDSSSISLLGEDVTPMLKYVVNKDNTMVKTFDISTFGGRFYGGDSNIDNISFEFRTPLKQRSYGKGTSLITNREYDFRLDIPRNNNSLYGDRMRGKTMQCELKSDSNSNDFSLQYIITKYRMSWS